MKQPDGEAPRRSALPRLIGYWLCLAQWQAHLKNSAGKKTGPNGSAP